MSPPPLPTVRADLWARLTASGVFDLAVVGGGATGLGVALDAAARGLKVVLLESHDFAEGTSSRSTKLVHGGVRYLAQGRLSLVREALHERATLLRNAPHLVHPLPFVMPCYRWWEKPYYGTGLALYDTLAGRGAAAVGLGGTQRLNAAEVQTRLPNVQSAGLVGGVQYWDAQFDDARLAIAIARTAAAQGALLLNHCAVTGLLRAGGSETGRVTGVVCQDAETGRRHSVSARCVVNATGVWVDGLRAQDGDREPLVVPSQGIHLVLDAHFLSGQHAMLIPRTSDGRVLFALPWWGHTLLGTTDTPRPEWRGRAIPHEPDALASEVDFLLDQASRWLSRSPSRRDVRSVWAGLRPLVKPEQDSATGTSHISREHTVRIGPSGLVTVTGGKWTTYRSMAEDVLARCMAHGLLPHRAPGITEHLPLVGAWGATFSALGTGASLSGYGCEAATVAALPGANRHLGGGLTEAMVRFAVRHEYARTVADVLARRTRLLSVDAELAAALAPEVASVLAQELDCCEDVQARCERFKELALTYCLR